MNRDARMPISLHARKNGRSLLACRWIWARVMFMSSQSEKVE